MKIGKRIKDLKSILNTTSKDLALELGIPVRTVGSYERDEAQPGSKFVYELIDKYGVNANWLLTGEGTVFIDGRDNDNGFKPKPKFNLSEEEQECFAELTNSKASKDMLLKILAIKKGDKEAIDKLIYNLQGVKAFLD